jgi:SPX domain
MKFGKELRNTVAHSMPEWRPMFMSYKALKKSIYPAPAPGFGCDSPSSDDGGVGVGVAADAALARKNAAFFRGLKDELDKVNAFFLDKQEDYVILAAQYAKDVADALEQGAERACVVELKRQLVEFHGCLVLLDNYSHVNYQGFRKILKKHDKKTGLSLRNAYLSSVNVTPFLVSDTVRRLLVSTEQRLADLDTITKFRRADPTSAAPTFAPVPGPRPSPPHPNACIGARSALYRVWRDATDHVSANELRPPSLSLMDNVDAVTPEELGIDESFLRAVPGPADYVIAATDKISMGFFVLGPDDAPLQMFKRPRCDTHSALTVTKLMRGQATLQLLATAPMSLNESSIGHPSVSVVARESSGASVTFPAPTWLAPSDQPDMSTSNNAPVCNSGADNATPVIGKRNRSDSDTISSKAFTVSETRCGSAVGPWPAVSSSASSQCVQWTPKTEEGNVAIFYVMSPPTETSDMLRYRIEPATNRTLDALPEFHVQLDTDANTVFDRVHCW